MGTRPWWLGLKLQKFMFFADSLTHNSHVWKDSEKHSSAGGPVQAPHLLRQVHGERQKHVTLYLLVPGLVAPLNCLPMQWTDRLCRCKVDRKKYSSVLCRTFGMHSEMWGFRALKKLGKWYIGGCIRSEKPVFKKSISLCPVWSLQGNLAGHYSNVQSQQEHSYFLWFSIFGFFLKDPHLKSSGQNFHWNDSICPCKSINSSSQPSPGFPRQPFPAVAWFRAQL